jgi:hypothetical protein
MKAVFEVTDEMKIHPSVRPSIYPSVRPFIHPSTHPFINPSMQPVSYTDNPFLFSDTRVRFPALPGKKVVGLERGPLSLVRTTEELLDRKAAAPV